MTDPFTELSLEDEQGGATICPDCGADLEWHRCGEAPPMRDVAAIIRRVVEAHDGLCLDVRAERERLIRALVLGLTSSAPAV